MSTNLTSGAPRTAVLLGTATTTTSRLTTPIKTDDGDVTEAVSKIVWTGGTIASLAADTGPKSPSGGSDTAARALGVAGLGGGVLGLGTAIVAQRRKNTPSS